jgi:hypothetical protein
MKSMLVKLRSKLKRLFKNEIFIFSLIMSFLMSYIFIRSSNYYDKILSGSKYQVLKKEQRK